MFHAFSLKALRMQSCIENFGIYDKFDITLQKKKILQSGNIFYL